jgi:S1-C subfamily serine protease
MKRTGKKEHSARRWGRLAVSLGGICLAAVALPAHADDDVMGQMDRQVTAIVARAKPSIVSIRVARRSPSSAGYPPTSRVPADARRQLRQDRSPEPGIPSDRSSVWRLEPGVFRARVGTGFAVDRDGTVVTTTDVVGNATQVTVRLGDGRELDGKVLGADPVSGVAVVKVSGTDLPALQWAEKDRPEAGQWAIVVGNQLDTEERVWVGTLARTDVVLARPGPIVGDSAAPGAAAYSQDATIEPLVQLFPPSLPEEKLLQISAPVGPGASGAPVLDSRGRVIGVVVATSGPERLSLAGEIGSREDAVAKLRGMKDNPEWQRRVQEITKKAEQTGQRAAEHARVLSAQIAEKAKQLAAEATKHSQELQGRFEKEKQQIERDSSKTEAERQQLIQEKARQMQRELEPQMRELHRQMEQVLKPLQDELQRQLKTDLAPLQEELKQLNETLPVAPGLRELRVDVAPEISAAMAQAREAVRAALEAVTKSGWPDAPPPAPAAPAAPSPPPAGPATPTPPVAPLAAPSPPNTPGSAPAAPAAPPAPAASLVHAALAADEEPEPPDAAFAFALPAVQYWAGRGPGGGASTYAIPAATAAWAVGQIREHGHVARPFLGVQLHELTPDERKRLNAPEEARVRVGAVTPESPAQEAGLQKDDLILEFQGKKIEHSADLMEQLAREPVGGRVSLVVWRDGQRRTVSATLRERPSTPWLFRGPAFTLQPRAFTMVTPNVTPRTGPMPRSMRIYAPGRVSVTANGTGRGAVVNLEAQDAELEAVLRELSRATGRQFTAEGEAARQRITLQVERVPVDDLIESLGRLYHLRSERRGDAVAFRSR